MEIPLTPSALIRAFEAPASALSTLPRVLADLAASVESLARAGQRADDVAEDLAALVQQTRVLVEDTSGPVQQVAESTRAAAEVLPPERAREVAEAVASMPESTARFNEQGERMNAILARTETHLDRIGPLLEQALERVDGEVLARLAGVLTAERVDQLEALLVAAPEQAGRVPALLDATEAVLPRVPELLLALDAVLPRLPALLDAVDGLLPRLPALLDTVDGVLPRLPALLDATDGLLPRLPALLDLLEREVLVPEGLLGLPAKMDPMAQDTAAIRENVAGMRTGLDDMVPQMEAMGQVIEGMPGATFAKRRATDGEEG